MKYLKILLLVFMAAICLQSRAQGINSDQPLKGMRIGVIGDSYVKNHLEPVEYTWHYKFAQKYGMEYFNYGLNGNCIAQDRARFGEAMFTRYAAMADSLDYVVVIAGHNDTYMLDSMGGFEVFRERLDILCRGLIDKYPTAKIFFFTRWTCDSFAGSDAERVVDAMIEIGGRHGIPVLDCARDSGIYAASEAFREIYFQRKTDDAHLNARGHDRFLRRAESFLLQY